MLQGDLVAAFRDGLHGMHPKQYPAFYPLPRPRHPSRPSSLAWSGGSGPGDLPAGHHWPAPSDLEQVRAGPLGLGPPWGPPPQRGSSRGLTQLTPQGLRALRARHGQGRRGARMPGCSELHWIDTVQNYCQSSSLHGLRYVGDADISPVER